MALKQAELRRVATAIEMLTRAILVDNDTGVAVNLQKSRDIIDNILKQGRRFERGNQGGQEG